MNNLPVEQIDRINMLLAESLAVADALAEVDPFSLEQRTIGVLSALLGRHLRELKQLLEALPAPSTSERKESEE